MADRTPLSHWIIRDWLFLFGERLKWLAMSPASKVCDRILTIFDPDSPRVARFAQMKMAAMKDCCLCSDVAPLPRRNNAMKGVRRMKSFNEWAKRQRANAFNLRWNLKRLELLTELVRSRKAISPFLDTQCFTFCKHVRLTCPKGHKHSMPKTNPLGIKLVALWQQRIRICSPSQEITLGYPQNLKAGVSWEAHPFHCLFSFNKGKLSRFCTLSHDGRDLFAPLEDIQSSMARAIHLSSSFHLLHLFHVAFDLAW